MGTPTSRFGRLVVFAHRGRRPGKWLALPSADLTPLQSLTRVSVRRRTGDLAPSGFLPPTAQPSRPSHHPRASTPGSCCVPAVPACLDALLPKRPPRCVSTGRAHGVLPTELDLAEIVRVFRPDLPSCDWRTRCGAQGRQAASRTIRRPVPRGTARPRFRGLIPLPVGADAFRISPSRGALALLGFSLPGAFPSPDLGPQAVLLPGTWGKAPVLGLLPCTPECQRTGKLACLSRGCRPLQGFRPHPAHEEQVSD